MRVSSSTTAPVASDSRSRSGRFASAAAERRSESGGRERSGRCGRRRPARRRRGAAAPRRRRGGGFRAAAARTARPAPKATPRPARRDRRAGAGRCRGGSAAAPAGSSRRGARGPRSGRREHGPRRLGAERGRDLGERARLAAEPRSERVEEASFRRLDRAPVQGHDGGAALACVRSERREQRGLADAGEAVDEHDDRHVLTDELQQRSALAVTPHEPGRLPVEQRAECRSHASQVYAGASVAEAPAARARSAPWGRRACRRSTSGSSRTPGSAGRREQLAVRVGLGRRPVGPEVDAAVRVLLGVGEPRLRDQPGQARERRGDLLGSASYSCGSIPASWK